MSEVSENEEDFNSDEAADENSLCYYMMNSGMVEEQKDVFEKPSPVMLYHLKPLFIRAKVVGMPVNKVFVDGGVAVNLMPHALFKGSVGRSFDLIAWCYQTIKERPVAYWVSSKWNWLLEQQPDQHYLWL